MDYEFVRDLTGQCLARLSMGHEAFGSWLTDEVGEHPEVCDDILAKIASVQNSEETVEWKGHTFQLYLDNEAATVSALELQFETAEHNEDEVEAGMSYYDDELFAACGLEDFQALIQSWRDFITEK